VESQASSPPKNTDQTDGARLVEIGKLKAAILQ
jgi:hypothetical protein